MKVVYEPEADQELSDAAVFVAQAARSLELGERPLYEAAQCEQRISERPNAWPRAGRQMRQCLVTTFPYKIVYRVEGDIIRIYAFAHVKRRPGYWTKRVAR